MSEGKRLRRPAEGGYARGDETRLRIIHAAIELFGERGFAAASTRDIASRAGVNAPALQYYFENKEGVYRACAEHMVDAARAHFEPVMRRASEVLADAKKASKANEMEDTPALIEAFLAVQEAMADKMFLSLGTPLKRLFFAREQMGQEPPIASEVLQQGLREPLNRICAELVARIGGTRARDPLTLMRVMLLNGQLVVFHASPRSALQMFGWTEIDASKSEFIKSTVRMQTRALLEMWSAERQSRLASEHTNRKREVARSSRGVQT
jgi:AcrR family transcriptional regulator